MGYVYRVMSEYEVGPNKELLSATSTECMGDIRGLGFKLGKDALDEIGSQVTQGNKRGTLWISCSKSFDVVNKYAIYTPDFRPTLAVISDHDKDEVVSPELCIYASQLLTTDDEDKLRQTLYKIRNMSLDGIRKLVLDLSKIDKECLYYLLCQLDFVIKKDGNIKENINFRECNYASSSSEVLVLGSIPKKDYFILNPFQYDIVYAILSSNPDISLETVIAIVKNHFCFSEKRCLLLEILKRQLTDEEKYVFMQMYIFRKTITNINQDGSTYSEILKLQTSIIQKAVELFKNNFYKEMCTNNIEVLGNIPRFYKNKYYSIK